MRHSNPTTQKISDNFERFNPYAAKALECVADDESLTYASLAFAFELSQLRYQIAKRGLDSDSIERLQSAR